MHTTQSCSNKEFLFNIVINQYSYLCVVSMVEGATLNIMRVNRHQFGAFLCIASNGVPPSVSVRIMLIVNCECNVNFLISSLNVLALKTIWVVICQKGTRRRGALFADIPIFEFSEPFLINIQNFEKMKNYMYAYGHSTPSP